MILFPIALVWLVVALIWIVGNSTNEPDAPEQNWRRFVPRVPRRPWNSGPGSRRAARKSVRSG
jgi:hypothetical protein